jgi:hypothetical protein
MLLASGRDCDVYAHGEGRVLRRNRDGRSATGEAAMMRRLAGLGYSVPVLHEADGPDIVMERVSGPTLAGAVYAGTISVTGAAELLAGLHDDLHALAWPDAGPGESLLHLDLHPLNILMSPAGPVVIDWSNARHGPAGLDVALTALILAQMVVTPGMLPDDPELEQALRAVSEPLLHGFATRVRTPYAAYLPNAVALRQQDPNQTADELALLRQAALAAADAV